MDVPQCVLVGKQGWRSKPVIDRLRATNFEGRTVSWLKNLSDIELGALYDGALFTVVPSLSEGWGLAVGESLAHGVPCISTNQGGTLEAGKGIGAQFDPAISGALKRALRVWLGNPGELERARIEVRRFQASSWNDAGQALLEVLLK